MKHLSKILAICVLTTAPMFVAVPQASAATSFIRNDKFLTDYSPACSQIGCPSIGWLVKDGTGFTMHCWQDGPLWTKGVYNTYRWFRGHVDGIWGDEWVPSVYVQNQTVVGHC